MNLQSPLIQPLHLDQFKVIRDVIEDYRKKEFGKILNWFIGGFVVAIVSAIWNIINNVNSDLGGLVGGLFLCVIFPIVAAWQIDKNYREFFSTMLIPELIKRFNMQHDVELQYSILSGISQSTFESCGLFRHPNKYKSTELLNGKIGKTQFQCASVLAQEVRQNIYGHNRKDTVTIFSGLFFIADSNKNFNGTTFVIPDAVEALLGQTGHSLRELFARHRFGRCELVSMEDPNFERNFAIYSTDQIEVRYLLTPLLMQQILAIRNKWNCPIHIAFIYGKLFMGIDTPQNWFEPPSVFTSVSAEVIQLAHHKILMMLSLVDQLGLNTRIWGRT